MRNPRTAYIIRIIAGGYLIYLAYQIITGGLMTGEMQGRAKAIGIVASALFIVTGAFIAGHALFHLRRVGEEAASDAPGEEEGTVEEVEQEPEETYRPPTLFERAGRKADDDS